MTPDTAYSAAPRHFLSLAPSLADRWPLAGDLLTREDYMHLHDEYSFSPRSPYWPPQLRRMRRPGIWSGATSSMVRPDVPGRHAMEL